MKKIMICGGIVLILMVILVKGLYSPSIVEPKNVEIVDVNINKDSILTFEVKLNKADVHYQYIGNEWSSAIIDNEKAVVCYIFKKYKIRKNSNDTQTFTFEIPLERITKSNTKVVYYGDGDDKILIWRGD